MKLLITICLLLISTPLVADAQGSSNLQPSLTRAQTREAERRLSDLGYWTGAVDGIFDPATRSALIAFQKWEGRPVTGRLTIDEVEAIQTSRTPTAREVGYEHVEVDIDRQVLLVVDKSDRVRVLPISTGSGKPFLDKGQMSIAYTPRGRFLVYDKTLGWERGEFSAMYYSNYISGGVAIHGYRDVPTVPASHGCIRIPMFAAHEVSKLLKLGTIVLIYDRVSFVSGKPWAENPKLKEAALLSGAFVYEAEHRERTRTRSRLHRGE